MNRRGHRGRTDGNQRAVVQALRASGAKVCSLAQVGEGCPDLLVLYRGRVRLMEVKQPKGTLTGQQQEWMAQGWPVLIVSSPDEAIAALAVCGGGLR